MTGLATLAELVAEDRGAASGVPAELGALVLDLATAFKEISAAVARGPLASSLGDARRGSGRRERRKDLDLLANEILLGACEWDGRLAALASREMDAPYAVPVRAPRGRYLLVVDPLDGSRSLDANVPPGTIFSVLARPDAAGEAGAEAFLQPGARQVCAGYAIYGPATLLVLTAGRGVHGFTLDPSIGEFVLTHPGMCIPEETHELAMNASVKRFWEAPVRRYVEECLAGRSGPRGADFDVRWSATLVADVHRILVRGGVLLRPRDAREQARPGRLSLLYAAAPMALLVEQAGGLASTGSGRVLDVVPRALDERVPVILGSRREVERIAGYHADAGEDRALPYTSPLFNVRSLLRET